MIAKINDPGIQKVFKNIIQIDNKMHILNGFKAASWCNFESVNISVFNENRTCLIYLVIKYE